MIKLAEKFLKESGAEGPVHRRLRRHLEAFADLLEVDRVLTQLDGNFPDVLRATWAKPPVILIGDAKDANNQRLADSAAQMGNYCASAAAHIKSGAIGGAVLIVATDDEKAAVEWVKGLPDVASKAGLRLTQDVGLNKRDDQTFFAIAVASG